jgi:hypothetical protein
MQGNVAAGILLTALALVFAVALTFAILIVLSLPHVLLVWPPHLGWSGWPSGSYVR